MASQQVAPAAEQDNNATAQLGPGELLAMEVPQAKVARLARRVDKAVELPRVDEAVAQAVKSRAVVDLRDPVVRPERVAPVEMPMPQSLPAPRDPAEALVQVDLPGQEACPALVGLAWMLAFLAREARLDPVALAAKVE